jgi:hypothetical protein
MKEKPSSVPNSVRVTLRIVPLLPTPAELAPFIFVINDKIII